MLNFFRYRMHDTFWSLKYAWPSGRVVTLLRFGWYECIGLTVAGAVIMIIAVR